MNFILVIFNDTIGWLDIPSYCVIENISLELLYMAVIAGVLAFFVWNTGNRII